MDSTLKQLLSLAEKANVEQRCAALLVLGALKLEEPQIVKTATAALDHPNPVVQDFAFRYFEQVEPNTAIPSVLRFLDDPDKEMQERAVRLLSRAGQAAVPALVERASGANRIWQLNAARVLCAVRGPAALKGLLRILLVRHR